MTIENYLLDTNALITPFNLYYPFDIAPGFWHQMELAISKKNVFIIDNVYDEIMNENDNLASWLKSVDNLNRLSTKTHEIINNYGQVQRYVAECGYYKKRGIDAWADEKIADPWLIAAAIKYKAVIITFEKSIIGISAKGQTFKSVKIPDVASQFKIRCENLFYFMRKMGIKWDINV